MGYMAADNHYQRFFTYLNLFIFFMLLLVMGNNLLMLFIGWEGVGLCSYLLIGYFFEKQSAADAAKKAFIVNRIGDVGVLIGMFFLFHYFGTLDFVTGASGVVGMTEAAPVLVAAASTTVITTLLLMLFLGLYGQIGANPAVYLASRRNGRPDAGVCADPCRDDGDGGRVSRIPDARAVLFYPIRRW